MSTITADSPYQVSSGYQVETFETADASHSDASTMAHDAAAMELIQSLGLEGQKTLVNTDTATRLPYRSMEAAEMLVYKALCDQVAKVESYKGDAIPLRVLQVIAHARELAMFTRLEVWSPSVAKIDDPVLVGVIEELIYPDQPQYSNLKRDVFYILARWGKCLLPLEQLEAAAVSLLRTKRLVALAKMAQELQTGLSVTKETNDLAYLSVMPYASNLNG